MVNIDEAIINDTIACMDEIVTLVGMTNGQVPCQMPPHPGTTLSTTRHVLSKQVTKLRAALAEAKSMEEQNES